MQADCYSAWLLFRIDAPHVRGDAEDLRVMDIGNFRYADAAV